MRLPWRLVKAAAVWAYLGAWFEGSLGGRLRWWLRLVADPFWGGE